MNKFLLLLLLVAVTVVAEGQNPPITPAWAFGHIVWEDSLNTETGALSIVDAYLEKGIPVNGVIIDSPWSTAYNDFEWDKSRYPDPDGMIKSFMEKNVKVILWLTGVINNKSKDTRLQQCVTFDEVAGKKLGVNNSEPCVWWKGEGIHIDFTNRQAVDWWAHQLDKVFVDGVYGWKVDQGEYWFGDVLETSRGKMSNELFRPFYYDAMYDYTVSRNPDAITIARPYSHQGGYAAGVGKMSMGWCGDFSGDWSGLKQQIQNIYISARRGYGAVGCEIAGFFKQKSNKEQFVRYAQFGCMTACMINGGENGAFSNHLPWWHGKDVEDIYRECVQLHNALVPYMFSTVVDAHLHGGSLIKNSSLAEESHQLGDCLFTKAVTAAGGHASFHLPSDGWWIDFRTGEKYEPSALIDRQYSLAEFPLFVKAGAVIPVFSDEYKERLGNVSCQSRVAVLLYPNGKTARTLHLPCGEGVAYEDCVVLYDEQEGTLCFDEKENSTIVFVIKNIDRAKNVKNCISWNFDKKTKELIIFAESKTKIRIVR